MFGAKILAAASVTQVRIAIKDTTAVIALRTAGLVTILCSFEFDQKFWNLPDRLLCSMPLSWCCWMVISDVILMSTTSLSEEVSGPLEERE